ncbi:helix-turn-helix domain-containing protein [uncultured Thiocystis sp.]|uniref:helix-turn-helix domain-containing protein n=1 Tax=uncultured Thiocystis sp. TaxID=1202134 RepID=UPI0025E5E04A|nr:helix-turn-helix domain-containing protein [uncultured Thiocystis sp.]
MGEDLLESIRQMKAGQGTVAYSPVIATRQQAGLSPPQFAALLGVSLRALRGWEQGKRHPSGTVPTDVHHKWCKCMAEHAQRHDWHPMPWLSMPRIVKRKGLTSDTDFWRDRARSNG